MLLQQGLAKEGDHLIHRASCGLAGCIYQVAGEDGMRRFSLRLHAGGVRGREYFLFMRETVGLSMWGAGSAFLAGG